MTMPKMLIPPMEHRAWPITFDYGQFQWIDEQIRARRFGGAP